MSVLELLERPNLINKEKQLSALKLAANVQIIGLLLDMVEKWDPVLGSLDPMDPLNPPGPPGTSGTPGTPGTSGNPDPQEPPATSGTPGTPRDAHDPRCPRPFKKNLMPFRTAYI